MKGRRHGLSSLRGMSRPQDPRIGLDFFASGSRHVFTVGWLTLGRCFLLAVPLLLRSLRGTLTCCSLGGRGSGQVGGGICVSKSINSQLRLLSYDLATICLLFALRRPEGRNNWGLAHQAVKWCGGESTTVRTNNARAEQRPCLVSSGK